MKLAACSSYNNPGWRLIYKIPVTPHALQKEIYDRQVPKDLSMVTGNQEVRISEKSRGFQSHSAPDWQLKTMGEKVEKEVSVQALMLILFTLIMRMFISSVYMKELLHEDHESFSKYVSMIH